MGLWLKCPKCETANSLDLKSCINCNASLENLPADKRVYILGKEPPVAPKAAPKAAKAPVKKAPAAPRKTAKAMAGKKEEVDLEVISSDTPPPKRLRGPKALRKRA
jgi:hypothetical protein|uniref:Uncharacterized protein n=1 Tax=Desulfobacca acetoxidans TaxID=60893 RepID=A0A7V6A4X0_9BACT